METMILGFPLLELERARGGNEEKRVVNSISIEFNKRASEHGHHDGLFLSRNYLKISSQSSTNLQENQTTRVYLAPSFNWSIIQTISWELTLASSF